MQVIAVFVLAFVACAFAAPQQNPKDATILRYDNDVDIDKYNYAVETSDGQSRQEQGQLQNVGTDNESIAVRGSYSFVLDGVTYTVTYIADENGFQPQGDHLPKAQ